MRKLFSAPTPVATGSVFDAALQARVAAARDLVVGALLRQRDPKGGWAGELSASALATATAVTALNFAGRSSAAQCARLRQPVSRGCAWLIQHQNADGGWGDTTKSMSNISTTALCWAALGLCADAHPATQKTVAAAQRWLARVAGSVAPGSLVGAIERRYGNDRTFSIPILTMCALCGRLGEGADAWRYVTQLPFELAALPQRWFGAMQLPVVSYALPALIAIGHVRHAMHPTANPLLRGVRDRCRARTLRKLEQLQPENGGFLEATPLTSFVTMSLAALGHHNHPVVLRGVSFLEVSMRDDGSWPIDTNLTTWLTTLAVNALAPADGAPELGGGARQVRDWLLGQQYRYPHPYTLAAPGGWSWTNSPGGVPDADDTAGAILALLRLDPESQSVRGAVAAGVAWLLNLQNRDGGIPTFCRGWGRLAFDRSSPDITAHAVRAWVAAREILPPPLRGRVQPALSRAMAFLLQTQQPGGTWVPLWFGHQENLNDENPLYGTARVVLALAQLEEGRVTGIADAINRSCRWFVESQNADGGWSGAAGAASSVEETALALEAIAALRERGCGAPDLSSVTDRALQRGAHWLVDTVERGHWDSAVPIGFYFAKLWYFERLYPLIFAKAALARLARLP